MDPLFRMMGSSGSSQASDPWNLDSATFNTSVTNSLFPTGGKGFSIAQNGTKFWQVTSSQYDSTIHQFSLSTAWDFTSTISRDGSYTNPVDWGQKVMWKPDGSRLYFVNHDEDRIYQWDKSTDFDWNSSTTASSITSFNSQDNVLADCAFSSDGLKLFIFGQGSKKVHTWDLSTAWDVASTRSNYAASSAFTDVYKMEMSPDGTNFYFVNPNSGSTIEQRVPTTAYDVTTLPTTPTRTFDFSSNTSQSSPRSSNAAFKPDGTKMFIWEKLEPRILIYDL